MELDRLKLKLNPCMIELDGELERDKRLFVTGEYEIYDLRQPEREHDGTCDKVWVAKLVGSTQIKQEDKKVIQGKSKRSHSQRLRAKLWSINPDDEFYSIYMEKLINNVENVIEFLRDK